MRKLAVIIALVGGLTGCKAMGSLGSGLGHVASGLGHVAAAGGHVLSHVGPVLAHVGTGAAKVIGTTARVIAPLGHAAVQALPIVEDIVEGAAQVALDQNDPDPVAEPLYRPHPDPVSGPLIDDGDNCGYCPDNLACGQCGDVNGVECVLTAPGAYARCESQAKR